MCFKRFSDVFLLVVDDGIKAQFINEAAALVCATRDTNHARTFYFRNLANYGANGTGDTRHHNGVTGLGVPGLQKTKVALNSGVAWTTTASHPLKDMRKR